MALFIPTYFSPISQFAALNVSDDIVFEIEDNYQKQTYRSRCYIYGANGKQLLNVPVKYLKLNEDRKKTKDILVANETPWQSQHFKSLVTAYRSSPFFEYFEDDLAIIFNKEYKYLHDLNIDTFLFINEALELLKSYTMTSEYSHEVLNDFRDLAISKKEHSNFNERKYKQVFDLKHGFLPNLSILDLLFMEGPNTISFLE